MEEPYYHQETIALEKPKTGQEIFDGVSSLAKEIDRARLYVRKLPGKDVPYVVGLSNPYQVRQVQILTGENLDQPKLVLWETYEEIAVASTTGLAREVYPLWYSEEQLIASVREIASKLMDILK